MAGLKKKRNSRGGHRAYTGNLIEQIDANLEDKTKLRELGIQLREMREIIQILDEEILDLVSENDEDGTRCVKEVSDAGVFKEQIDQALLKLEEHFTQGESRGLSSFSRQFSKDSICSQDSQVSATSSATHRVRAKLPKLELKKFTGRPQDWQEFWDSYQSAIHDNEELSDVDKFSYLKYYLEEPAKKVIAGFSLTAKNYKEALNLLEQRYAKPTTIKNAHINDLLYAQAVLNERNVSKMRELYDKIETHYRGLNALGIKEESYSSIVTSALMTKIPDAVRLSMVHGTKDHQDWGIKEMLEAFRNELDIREQHVSICTGKDNGASHYATKERNDFKTRPFGKTPASASALFTKEENEKTRSRSCVFCNEEHEERNCHNVTSKEERKKLIFKFGRCLNCLSKSHRAFQCRSMNVCRTCKQKHHVAICESVLPPVPSAPPARGNTANSIYTTSCIGSIEYGGRAVLQTALALVKGQQGNAKARILFDTGSHRSFVTKGIVQHLGLKPIKRERLGIKTFGSQKVDDRMREIVELELKSVKDGKTVNICAYVVDDISSIHNEHVEILKKDYDHLANLWFSDVCKFQEVLEVDILVGIDWFWSIQDGNIIRGEPGSPVAVSTKLGWVLSGPIKGKKLSAFTETSINLAIGHDFQSVNMIGQDANKKLEADVAKLWDLETLGIRSTDNVHEELLDTVEHNGSRYSVRLPWKAGHRPLPTNYSLSVNRLKGQLRKLREQPEVLGRYVQVIKDQLQANIIEEVTGLEKQEKVTPASSSCSSK